MTPANKVMANTLILYIRMAVVVMISFYSTRLILASLGNSDFGIFSLISSALALFTFLNTAMGLSTHRFLSFYKGRNDPDKQRQVVASSFLLHVIIGVVVSIILLLAGLYFLDFLNLPADRAMAAGTLYHIQIVNIFFSIITIPFVSILGANEEMLTTAIVSVMQVLLTLAMALLLPFSDGDRLVVYGIFLTTLSILSFLFYGFYCYNRYPEYRFDKHNVNVTMVKSQLGNVGWNAVGLFVMAGRNHGLAVMLNLFFGARINAAYGIANQVNGQLTIFSGNVLGALYPQILKSGGAGNHEKMTRLSLLGSKYGYYMFALFAIPALFETEALLIFWLKEIPPHTVMFCQFIIIAGLCRQLTSGLPYAIQAVGHIRNYQILLSASWILSLPVAYMLLKSGYEIRYVMSTYIGFEFFACGIRLYAAKKIIALEMVHYFQKVLLKLVIPTVAYSGVCYAIVSFASFSGRFWVTGLMAMPVFLLCIYHFSVEPEERKKMAGIVNAVKQKINDFYSKK